MNFSGSLRELKDQRKREIFVGRKAEIRTFLGMIGDATLGVDPVLSIVGVGGIGKSRLLRQYVEICENKNIPVALVDGRDQRVKLGVVSGRVLCNLPEILQNWRMQLGQASEVQAFDAFDQQIERFTKILQKYWRSDKGDHLKLLGVGVEGFTSNAASSLIGAAIAGAPGAIIGAALGAVSGSLVSALGRTVSQLMGVGMEKTEAEFCANLELTLAESFAEGINSIAAQAERVVILIDTFELIQSFQDWLLNFLFETDISANVRWVIAGRAPLDSSRWYDWQRIIRTIELQPLDSDAAKDFLSECGVKDKTRVDRSLQITNGVPWALSLLVDDLAILEGDWDGMIEKGIQYEIAKQMVDRFLDQVGDEAERLLIEVCAVPLTFDADLIEAMLQEQFPGRVVWRRVMEYSFFDVLPSGRRFVTDPVREFILDRLKVDHPLTFRKWNDRACGYYRQVVQTSRNELEGFVWEYLYHYYSEDIEARSIFLPRREYMDRIRVLTPSVEDARLILEADQLSMGTDPEILYDLDSIETYLRASPEQFRIAADKDSGRVVGYTLVLVPTEDWRKAFEAKADYLIHTPEVVIPSPKLVCVDYLIDTIALIDPSDHVTAALLMRSLLPVLAQRPRKFYAMVVSDYGEAIVAKLHLNFHTTRYTSQGSPIRCYYFCMFAGQRNTPLYEALEKFRPDIPMKVACQGCEIRECDYNLQYSRSSSQQQ